LTYFVAFAEWRAMLQFCNGAKYLPETRFFN